MKKWVILIGTIAVFSIGGYLLLSFYAVKWVQPQLRRMLGPGFAVAEIKVKLTHLSISGIRYEGLHTRTKYFQAEEVRVYPSLLSLLKGPLRVREFMILQPSFYFYRSREGVFTGPWAAIPEKEKEIAEDGEKKGKGPIAIRIDRFRIEKGSVDFEDRKTGEPPAQIKLRELDLEIKDIYFPLISGHSHIVSKGKVEGKKREGDTEFVGWIDFKTMDMKTSLKVRKIELKTLEPYYRKRVSAEIHSGYMNVEAKITLEERMIDALGKLELTDLHIKEGEGTVFWIPAKTLIPLLQKRGDRIEAQFHMKGDMDDPQFNLQETFLIRTGIALAEGLGFPIKVVGKGIPEGAVKGDWGLVEELKSVEKRLKKKEEKQR